VAVGAAAEEGVAAAEAAEAGVVEVHDRQQRPMEVRR
jgi:hypothetical protein